MKLSKLSLSIPASMTLAISAKAKELKKEGKSIVAFTAGEPDFDTPDFIKDEARTALDKGITKYTPASGTLELKKAICEKLLKDNGLNYQPENIVISTGAKSSLYHALLALVDEGDEVIIPAPYWLTYPEQVKLVGGKAVIVDTREVGHKITKELLEKAITPKTKCVIINSPNNPTGAVYTKEELQGIADVCVKNDIYVISDEIYEKLCYEVEFVSIASLGEEIKKRTIVINGMSKSYAMTGWRIGYLACEKECAKAISNVQSHTTANPCSISQYASVKALIEGDQFCHDSKKIFAARRLLMIEFVKNLPNTTYIEPQGAFYLMINVSAYYGKKYGEKVINGSLDFAEALLDEGVALIPCLPFGDDNSVRLSYAVSETDIVKGFERLKKFLLKLK